MEGHWKIQGGGVSKSKGEGVSKAKLCKRKYGAKLGGKRERELLFIFSNESNSSIYEQLNKLNARYT